MTPYEAGQIDAKAGEFDPDESYSLDQTIEYQRGFDAEGERRPSATATGNSTTAGNSDLF